MVNHHLPPHIFFTFILKYNPFIPNIIFRDSPPPKPIPAAYLLLTLFGSTPPIGGVTPNKVITNWGAGRHLFPQKLYPGSIPFALSKLVKTDPVIGFSVIHFRYIPAIKQLIIHFMIAFNNIAGV